MTAGVPTAVDLFSQPEYRIEGRDKVSGRMQYTADIARPGTLWAAFVMSPHASARIVRIDRSGAEAVTGVKAVLTGADIGPRRFGRQLYDWPVLAYDVVRFIGERVAAVAAETREAAEEAARAIRVVYEPLPAILDVDAALEAGAPVLHPEWDAYHFPVFNGRPRPQRPHPNVQGAVAYTKGESDLTPIFARAHRVFEHTFHTPRQHCGYVEPHAALVWIDGDDVVHVQSPNKSPFALRDQLSFVAEIPPERIVVETSAIGGDFGGKGLTIDEFACYFLAKATGRPVRHVQSYGDELTAGTTRHRTSMTLKTAVDEDGKFVAHASRVVYDGGAYAAGKPVPLLVPGYGYGAIPYHVPNVRLDVTCVYTNTVPAAHMRGPAEVQTFFAWEQHVDIIAAALDRDPLEFRICNVMREGETALTGEAMHHPMGREVLEQLARESARTALPPGRARGVSLVCTHTGGGKTAVRMRLSADGGVEIVLGVPDQGAGVFTAVRRVAAAALSIDPERISVRRGTTAEAPMDPGSGASRVTHIVGRAVEDAAQKLRAEIARGASGPLEVIGTFDGDHHGDGTLPDYTFGAYAVDVELDRATGAFRLCDAVFVADVGPIINPTAHRGQIAGGFVYGLGGALSEEIEIDEDGRISTASLGDYKLPTVVDVPPLRTVYVAAPPGNGPHGAKMAGELSNSGVAPAIANAVSRAGGIRIYEFPITAERVFAALTNDSGKAQR
ncbi:MAG TPA: xanthine dehydrogenase family protein molybdopterin-binding subunit [Candidatus Binatia bacterium]|nr:xanthine dehydrogenase family protein molybdopterin-binding subunit [Candidatus Binatia bacterium]